MTSGGPAQQLLDVPSPARWCLAGAGGRDRYNCPPQRERSSVQQTKAFRHLNTASFAASPGLERHRGFLGKAQRVNRIATSSCRPDRSRLLHTPMPCNDNGQSETRINQDTACPGPPKQQMSYISSVDLALIPTLFNTHVLTRGFMKLSKTTAYNLGHQPRQMVIDR